MDKIILKGLQFYGYHGLFQEERKLGQRFLVDVELHTSLQKAGQTDNMLDSIHYGEAFDAIKEVVEGEPMNLIEAVAEKVATNLLAQFPTLEACLIKVIKPNPPIPGHYKEVAVEIFREKSA